MSSSTPPKAWEEAGLIDDRGELGSPGAPGPIWVPEPPSLKDGFLVWRSEAGAIQIRPVYPSAGLLRQFAGLAGAPDPGYMEFALRWGMLAPDGYPLPR